MTDTHPTSSLAQVQIIDLTKVYRTRARGRVLAVDGLNLEFKGGQIIGLLGPNGAGKTTLIKMVCGLVLPSEGRILVNGASLLAQPQQVFRSVGVVLEGNRNLYWRLTVEENLRYFGTLRGLSGRALRDRIDEILEFIDLKAERRVLGKDLSRGMQQRVGIGLALFHDPQILLLDEPMLGLDVHSVQMLRRKLRDLAVQGRIVLISTHQMREAQGICDNVVIMNKGRVIAHDSVRNLLNFFSTSLYAIEVRKPLSADQVERVQALAPYVVVKENVIQVLAEKPATLYQVIEVLQETLTPIIALAEETNLESIFIALTAADRPVLQLNDPADGLQARDLRAEAAPLQPGPTTLTALPAANGQLQPRRQTLDARK